MNEYAPNSVYYAEFVTSLATGAATDADALPTANATKNGVDDGSFALTCAKIDTGRYKITGTVPNGYASGDRVQISVAATIGGVAAKGVVDAFTVRVGNVDAVNVNKFKDVNQTPRDLGAQLDGKISDVTAKTNNLPASPASEGNVTSVAAAVATRASQTSVDEVVAKTGNLPADPARESTLVTVGNAVATRAAPGDAMTLTPSYDAAKNAATQQSVTNLADLAQWLKDLARGETARVTLGGITYLITKHPVTEAEMLRKRLKDKGGADLPELAAGELAIEEASNS